MDNTINIGPPKSVIYKEIPLHPASDLISEESQSSNPPLDEKALSIDVNVTEVVDGPDIVAPKAELHRINSMNYAGNKNLAEGLMDIALLSANANQLRFLLTYNEKARTYYISLGLVGLSLVLQVVVGMALIFKRHLRRNDPRYFYTKEFLVFGVFVVTVVNILLAAFTTTNVENARNQ